MLQEIKSWIDSKVLFSLECGSLKLCLEAAVKAGANLYGANLVRANLYGANLDGANLVRANLDGANLDGANLDGANLYGANLVGANLVRANLYGANLVGANLVRANLVRANLDGANLVGANLDGANLVGANLDGAGLQIVRDDLWAVLSSSPAEVPALLKALEDGKVDGSTYTGKCCCLVGTLAKERGCRETEIPGLTPKSWRPAEMWFTAIHPGDVPSKSKAAKQAVEWVEDWLARVRGAFAPKRKAVAKK